MKKDEMLKQATMFWRVKLENPDHDNGDQEYGLLASLLMNSMNKKLLPSELDKFQIELSKAIDDELQNSDSVELSCDYAPCSMLSDAAKAAGFDSQNFPWKTSMYIRKISGDNFKISIFDGYRAPEKILE